MSYPLTQILTKDLTYCDPKLKSNFHRKARMALRRVATELGLSSRDYDLQINPGGIAVSGEVILHTNSIYIMVSQFCNGDVLYRTCDGRKDYCGGTNHFCSAKELEDVEQFCRIKLLPLIGKS